MTQSIRDLLEKIADAKRQLIANREADALRIALDQTALIKLRIQATGEQADGTAFEPYTPGYKKQRQGAGFQIAFVDFTRTGQLFASIRPVVVASNIFSATVEIGPQDANEAGKLAGLQKKRPGILEPSPDELKAVRAANRARILKYLQF
jgi:hypothetical protein